VPNTVLVVGVLNQLHSGFLPHCFCLCNLWSLKTAWKLDCMKPYLGHSRKPESIKTDCSAKKALCTLESREICSSWRGCKVTTVDSFLADDKVMDSLPINADISKMLA